MNLIANKGVKSIAALAVLFIGAIPFESCSDNLPGEEYLGGEVQPKRYVSIIDKESFGNYQFV